jgi:hypothetical protein
MDEESVGLFGMLLIVTILVLSHPLSPSHAMPASSLGTINWQDVLDAFGCKNASSQDCVGITGQ